MPTFFQDNRVSQRSWYSIPPVSTTLASLVCSYTYLYNIDAPNFTFTTGYEPRISRLEPEIANSTFASSTCAATPPPQPPTTTGSTAERHSQTMRNGRLRSLFPRAHHSRNTLHPEDFIPQSDPLISHISNRSDRSLFRVI